jgi:predicted DNA-binding transcriptional regulator YafY
MAKRNQPPFITLPLLSNEEIDALLLGLCNVELDDASDLASVAEALIERIVASLPPPADPETMPLISRSSSSLGTFAAEIRTAVLTEHSLRIAYSDGKGAETERTIWPIELYSEGEEDGTVLAWCETRKDYRNFRTDRIRSSETLDRYPVRRQLLLARWAAQQVEDFY